MPGFRGRGPRRSGKVIGASAHPAVVVSGVSSSALNGLLESAMIQSPRERPRARDGRRWLHWFAPRRAAPRGRRARARPRQLLGGRAPQPPGCAPPPPPPPGAPPGHPPPLGGPPPPPPRPRDLPPRR